MRVAVAKPFLNNPLDGSDDGDVPHSEVVELLLLGQSSTHSKSKTQISMDWDGLTLLLTSAFSLLISLMKHLLSLQI